MRLALRNPQGRPPAGLRRAPGPRSGRLLGHLHAVKADTLGFFRKAWKEHGDVVRLRFGPMRGHLLVAPDHLRHVLHDEVKNYTRDVRGFEKLRDILGNGLLTSSGDLWFQQRRLLQPEFDRRALPRFAPAMVQVAEDVAHRWDALARGGEPVDMARQMSALTLEVVGRTLLGAHLEQDAEGVAEALDWLMHDVNERIYAVFDIGERLPTRRTRRFRRELRTLDEAVYRILEERRRHPGGDDLVSRLLHAQQGEGMSARQLRDELMTFFLAGHETTAMLLSWTWYLLARHPEATERLHDELDDVLGGRPPNADDVERLDLTHRILQESLRLYPPAWFLERLCAADDAIDRYFLPAGSVAMVVPYLTHRHPDHWEEPERFDPDRFLPEPSARRHRWAWVPFGGGPRVCIGKDFAMLEAVLALATLAQRFEAELAEQREVVAEPLVTLRPQGGLPMRIRPRRGVT